MVEMPGGGLTMGQNDSVQAGRGKASIHALQVVKDEVRKSKPKTVELIIRLLKMDKDTASETYDSFQTTLNPTVFPIGLASTIGPVPPGTGTFH